MRLTFEQWRAMFTGMRCDAFHLELRDSYGVAGEGSRFGRWLAGERESYQAVSEWFSDWTDLVRVHAAAGRTVRRLRVVTEPLTPYIHFEWSDTPHNVEAGEDVRWLPRHQLPDVVFPYGGTDFWLLDDEAVVFTRFDDSGKSLGKELVEDPGVVAECAKVRDTLWPLAIPHSAYSPVLE